MKKILLSVLVLAVFITGCTSVPTGDIEITAAVDPKVNFSGYKTYAWLGSAGIVNDPDGQWEPLQFDADAEIQYLINSALRKRGMNEVSAEPDMVVAYAMGVDMAALKLKQDPESKLSTMENVPQAGLIVTLIDPETGFVAWAAVATGELKNLAPDMAKKRLEYVVNTMFKELPKK